MHWKRAYQRYDNKGIVRMIDIQSSKISSKFDIDSVGVLNLRYPIVIMDKITGETQRQVAVWRMGVRLAKDQRGTHMSRFIEELNQHCDRPMDLDAFHQLAVRIRSRLDSQSTDIKANFTWMRKVKSPISGLEGYLDCKVGFEAITGEREIKILTVETVATAVCPCSKAISNRGAHNQRAFICAAITLEAKEPSPSISGIIKLLEDNASSAVYPILKREDERYVTENAYDNPFFVEDLAREVANDLYDLPAFREFSIRVINQESIHSHDCYAEVSYKRRN